MDILGLIVLQVGIFMLNHTAEVMGASLACMVGGTWLIVRC
jgi:hypothetical protein